MILLIDNYDSFTYNLVHLVSTLDQQVVVRRNDDISVAEALSLGASSIILSPGPCTPNEAGICLDLVAAAADQNLPLLGVCLGHQSIAQAFGATITRAKRLMHGKTSLINHKGKGLFAGLPTPFTATRYHSLVADPKTLGSHLIPMAWAEDDGELMALQVQGKPIFGVQFHPESIASEQGLALIENFVKQITKSNWAAA